MRSSPERPHILLVLGDDDLNRQFVSVRVSHSAILDASWHVGERAPCSLGVDNQRLIWTIVQLAMKPVQKRIFIDVATSKKVKDRSGGLSQYCHERRHESDAHSADERSTSPRRVRIDRKVDTLSMIDEIDARPGEQARRVGEQVRPPGENGTHVLCPEKQLVADTERVEEDDVEKT